MHQKTYEGSEYIHIIHIYNYIHIHEYVRPKKPKHLRSLGRKELQDAVRQETTLVAQLQSRCEVGGSTKGSLERGV